MARVYFEVATQWMAEITPQQVADSQEDTEDTEDTGELQVGGSLATSRTSSSSMASRSTVPRLGSRRLSTLKVRDGLSSMPTGPPISSWPNCGSWPTRRVRSIPETGASGARLTMRSSATGPIGYPRTRCRTRCCGVALSNSAGTSRTGRSRSPR